MKKNVQYIDEIRFLVIQFIVLNHSVLGYELIHDKVNESLINFSFEVTSPILAVISGYLFFYNSSEKLDFAKKFKHRISSLVIPYLIWTLGFFIIYYVIKQSTGSIFHLKMWYDTVQPITVKNALGSLVSPPLANFWYLQNLILILPFNMLFYYVLKNRVLSVLFFIVIIFIFAYQPFSIYFSPRFLPFYLMGSYFGYHSMHLPKFSPFFRIPLIPSNVLASFVCIPLILFISIEYGIYIYSGLLPVIFKLLKVIIILIFTYNLLDIFPNGVVFRYLKKYKAYSFFLFAIHTFIFSIIQRPLFILLENRMNNEYFTLGFSLITSVFVIIISLILGIFVKSRFPKFFGLITGR